MIITAPIFALPMVIVTLGALTALFIFFELKKKRGRRMLRVLAIAIMMASLAGIMLRPKYPTKSSSAVLLLTPGYSENQVDSIVRQNSRLSVMHLSNAKPFRNSTLLQEQDLTNRKIDLVIGEGLPMTHLDRMRNTTFGYIPTTLPEGLVGINLNENYLPHRKATIRGTYNNPQGKTFISVHGPADVEDSINIHQKGENHFSLSFVPRLPGNYTYTLIIRDSAKTTREIVPIHVDDERTLKILFLQSYPTFETQYLKSYLAAGNHSMILRYQLSKNVFRYEYVNSDSEPVNRLSEQLLSNIDLVIADASSLAMLSSQERASLERSVNLGLGLLSLSAIDKNQPSNFFPFETIPIEKDTTSVRLGEKSFILPASPIRVKKNDSMVPLFSNKSGILNGYAFQNAGRIGFQLLHETYRLRLSGDSLAYAEIWAPLLEKIARRREENSRIKIVTPFPWHENEPMDIEVISADENIILMDDSIRIPVRENINVDNVWHGRIWAGKKGWHSLETNDGAVRSYYVQARPAWNALSITNQMRLNGLKSNLDANSSADAITTMKDVPPIIFYLTLIVTAGFIWLSPRL